MLNKFNVFSRKYSLNILQIRHRTPCRHPISSLPHRHAQCYILSPEMLSNGSLRRTPPPAVCAC